MKKRLLAVAILALASTIPGEAGPGGCTNLPYMDPFAFETITVSTTAIGFTAATYAPTGEQQADMAISSFEGDDVRYREDGTDPTTTSGHKVTNGSFLTTCGRPAIGQIKFIRDNATDVTLYVSYYRFQ